MLIKVDLSSYKDLSDGDTVDPLLQADNVGHFIFDPTLVVTDEDEVVLLDTFLKLLTSICGGQIK